ncbi:hypothetical protein IFR05_014942 [Cadophora sp. M221]|nr:hypothetical protein IFR05_014942 [Cadophora sp. M221]
MAQKLGYAFLEASAKDGGNFEESLLCIIVRQLQKPSAKTGVEALDKLVDSLPEWHDLLSHLEGELSRSAVANTRPLVQVLPLEEEVRLRPWQKLATLHVPRLAKRQRSFLGIKYFQPSSGPQSLASQNQKANSVGRGMSQPSEHSDHSMLEGNYDHQVQRAFGDILTFLSRIGRKLRDFKRKEKAAELRADWPINASFSNPRYCRRLEEENHNMEPLSLIPAEILSLIFSCLLPVDIKAARRVCHTFNDLASPHLLDTAIVGSQTATIERFEAIATHEIFRKYVTTVIFSICSLKGEYATVNDYYNDLPGQYEDPDMRRPTLKQCDEHWRNYQRVINDQTKLQESGDDKRRIQNALRRMPSISHLVLSSDAWKMRTHLLNKDYSTSLRSKQAASFRRHSNDVLGAAIEPTILVHALAYGHKKYWRWPLLVMLFWDGARDLPRYA